MPNNVYFIKFIVLIKNHKMPNKYGSRFVFQIRARLEKLCPYELEKIRILTS